MTDNKKRNKHIFYKKSRNKPTSKVTVYEDCRQILKNISYELKIPVVEIIYRILNHKNFILMLEDMKNNIDKDWHKQDLEELQLEIKE